MSRKNPSVLWTVDQHESSITKEGRAIAQKNLGIDEFVVDETATGIIKDVHDNNSHLFVTGMSRNSSTNDLQYTTAQPTLGDLVIDANKKNYSVGTNATTGTVELQDLSVSDPVTSGNTDNFQFISSVTQATNGKINPTKKTINTSGDLSTNDSKTLATTVATATLNSNLTGHKHYFHLGGRINSGTADFDVGYNNSNGRVELDHGHGNLTYDGKLGSTGTHFAVTDSNKNLVDAALKKIDDTSSASASTKYTSSAISSIDITANGNALEVQYHSKSLRGTDTYSPTGLEAISGTGVKAALDSLIGSFTADQAAVTDSTGKLTTESHQGCFSVDWDDTGNRVTETSNYVSTRAIVHFDQNAHGQIEEVNAKELDFVHTLSTGVGLSLSDGTATGGSGDYRDKTIKCNLKSNDALLSVSARDTLTPTTNRNVYPVVADSNSKLAAYVDPLLTDHFTDQEAIYGWHIGRAKIPLGSAGGYDTAQFHATVLINSWTATGQGYWWNDDDVSTKQGTASDVSFNNADVFYGYLRIHVRHTADSHKVSINAYLKNLMGYATPQYDSQHGFAVYARRTADSTYVYFDFYIGANSLTDSMTQTRQYMDITMHEMLNMYGADKNGRNNFTIDSNWYTSPAGTRLTSAPSNTMRFPAMRTPHLLDTDGAVGSTSSPVWIDPSGHFRECDLGNIGQQIKILPASSTTYSKVSEAISDGYIPMLLLASGSGTSYAYFRSINAVDAQFASQPNADEGYFTVYTFNSSGGGYTSTAKYTDQLVIEVNYSTSTGNYTVASGTYNKIGNARSIGREIVAKVTSLGGTAFFAYSGLPSQSNPPYDFYKVSSGSYADAEGLPETRIYYVHLAINSDDTVTYTSSSSATGAVLDKANYTSQSANNTRSIHAGLIGTPGGPSPEVRLVDVDNLTSTTTKNRMSPSQISIEIGSNKTTMNNTSVQITNGTTTTTFDINGIDRWNGYKMSMGSVSTESKTISFM